MTTAGRRAGAEGSIATAEHPKGVWSVRCLRCSTCAGFSWPGNDGREQLQAYVCSYADDLVILCLGTAEQALAVMRDLMRRIKLEVNEEKTRIVDARHASFDFLGYTFGPRYYPKNGAWYLGAAPSKARIRRLRKKVYNILRRGNQNPINEVIADLNRLLIGWSNFFSYGTVSKTYRVVDQYVTERLRRFLTRRHKG